MNLLFSKFKRFTSVALIALLALLIGVITGCGNLLNDPAATNNSTSTINHQSAGQTESNADEAPLTSFEEVAAYIRKHGKLPDNFITKNEAQALGWVAAEGNLHEVAPGKSIGGDRFGNREGLLPDKKGRIWYEADINYNGGRRNADRIVFSNDGLIYMTTDHYKSFTDITEATK